MKVLETLETNENGEATTKEYPSFNKKYYLREVKTADGYIIDSSLREIILKDNETLELIIKNQKEEEKEKIVEKEKVVEKVIMGQPKIIKEVIKLPKTGM